MTELVAVSRSATSKREEAVNLALIWNGRSDEVRSGRHRRAAQAAEAESA
jgi:hypothetical protein